LVDAIGANEAADTTSLSSGQVNPQFTFTLAIPAPGATGQHATLNGVSFQGFSQADSMHALTLGTVEQWAVVGPHPLYVAAATGH
jgi:hypothetical protein